MGSMFVSDLAVDALRQLGTRYLPLVPGASFRGFHDSVVNHGGDHDPHIVLAHHEALAVAIAHGYAKATGDVAVTVLHDLVGLMNAQMAIYNAWCDRVPLVMLGGGGPVNTDRRRPTDWLHSANAQAELVRPFVTFDAEPTTADDLIAAIARAHRQARTEPHAPTYVTLDMELQETAQDGLVLPADLTARARGIPGPFPDEQAVTQAAQWLLAAERPVILAGRTGLDPASTPVLVELAERTGAACLDSGNLTTFPTRHAHNLTGDLAALADADVVLAVDVTDLHKAMWDVRGRFQGRLIDASTEPGIPQGWTNAGRARPDADLVLFAPGTIAATAVLAEIAAVPAAAAREGATRDGRRGELAARHAGLQHERDTALHDRWDERPIAPSRMVAELHAAVRDRPWLLTLRNTRSWPEGVWDFDRAGRYLGHSGGAGVGYGPGGMVGGALAARDRGELAVAIIGDGDFLMGPGALWTAVNQQVPLLVVINDNHTYENDEAHQRRVADTRGRDAERSAIGTRIEDPEVDHAGLARSFGAWAEGPVTDPDELAGTLRRALEHVDSGGVAVVDVSTANN